MTILAYQNTRVEVIETWDQGGVTLAAVKACEGKPWADGAKTTTRTAYRTVKADELQPVKQNLLGLALEFSNKQQWAAGESVWLWRSANNGAFLKEQCGQVCLCLVGQRANCPVFMLDPWRGGWQPVANLESKYQTWAKKSSEVRA
jgi:hypothetical protein